MTTITEKNINVRGTVESATLGERVDDVTARAKSLYQRSKERAVELEGEFEGYVKEHPVRSVAIAAGVGVGVGLLIGYFAGRR
jgi:ElaB/YqjD/DUF883 family membrane-anchored ribosome-binding protein